MISTYVDANHDIQISRINHWQFPNMVDIHPLPLYIYYQHAIQIILNITSEHGTYVDEERVHNFFALLISLADNLAAMGC